MSALGGIKDTWGPTQTLTEDVVASPQLSLVITGHVATAGGSVWLRLPHSAGWSKGKTLPTW